MKTSIDFPQHLRRALGRRSSELGLPKITDIQIEPIRTLAGNKMVGVSSAARIEAVYFYLANEMAALATIPLIGRGIDKDEVGLKEVKREVDAAASAAFDAIASSRKRVSVGTSEAKDMDGAAQPGAAIRTAKEIGRERLQVAVDAVDGTTLTALDREEAVSISALFPALSSWHGFPDIQALALLIPTDASNQVRNILCGIDGQIEESVKAVLEEIARVKHKDIRSLRIMTHDLVDGSLHHLGLIEAINSTGAIAVVPDRTTIESPHVLGAFGIGKMAIDGMMGVLGGPEMVITAVQAHCLSGGQDGNELLFIPASNTFLRENKRGLNLARTFDFTPEERISMRSLGIQPGKVYSIADITYDAAECYASIVSVTGSDMLGLDRVRKDGQRLSSNGLLLDPFGNVFRLKIQRKSIKK